MKTLNSLVRMNRIIFLDIDGVLNHCNTPDAPMFHPNNIRPFNRIIRETGAQVVISSSWRSAVHSRCMTILGFETMLLTHRIRCKVIGVTPKCGVHSDRGWEIAAWIESNKFKGKYVCLDDDDDGILGRHYFVQTDPAVGLTEANADEAIKILEAA